MTDHSPEIEFLKVFPPELSRGDALSQPYLDDVPSHMRATLKANIRMSGMGGLLPTHLKLSVEFAQVVDGKPIELLEQLADEHAAAVLEAIASELRKRAAAR
jgi:hypothetical protein